MMIVVFAIDALEYELVEKFNCEKLKQRFYGKTDISEFSEPRTMILWSSFMTGRNREEEILSKGNREMWNTRFALDETFFRDFKSPVVIDLPGYSYDKKVHDESRRLLKAYFETDDPEEKERIRKQYNDDAFAHHRKVKEEFLKALKEDHDFVLGYFSAVDVIGHLNFGNTMLMKLLYKDMEDIASEIPEGPLIILSDHGMKAVGKFGDHSEYGFWSTNFKDLGRPKITDFKDIILGLK